MLTLKEIQEGMKKLKNWGIEGNYITEDFMFEDFGKSVEFVNKVKEIAEKHGHYPEIFISGKLVRLSLTTPSERCLSEKDFEVAGEIDVLVSGEKKE